MKGVAEWVNVFVWASGWVNEISRNDKLRDDTISGCCSSLSMPIAHSISFRTHFWSFPTAKSPSWKGGKRKLFQETSLQRHGKNDDLGNEKSIKNRNMCPVAMKEVRRYETIGQKGWKKNENSKLIMILFWLLATITRKRFTSNSRWLELFPLCCGSDHEQDGLLFLRKKNGSMRTRR